MSEPLTPGLYIVATPIGNLGDLTARAADVMARCNLLLAEDKRVTARPPAPHGAPRTLPLAEDKRVPARLLAHIGAKVPMRTYNDHSDEAERTAIVARLGTEAVALASDGGPTAVSRPAARRG